MGWIDYYKILERHGGDIKKASPAELHAAARTNPNDPITALYVASRKFEAKYPRHGDKLYVNDNGKLDDLPVNIAASKLFQKAFPIEEYPNNNDGIIVGDVLYAQKEKHLFTGPTGPDANTP